VNGRAVHNRKNASYVTIIINNRFHLLICHKRVKVQIMKLNINYLFKHFPCFCYSCYAAWDYILQLSKDKSDNQIMSKNVLYIIEEICSSSQGKIPPVVEKIVQQFTESAFFKSIFPIFVENTAKGSCSRY